MFRKILGMTVLLMLFAGVVSASSINGDYKGNPIVRVLVNGTEVQSDVPAINYDGSTLIPLRAAAEALGSTVEWIADKNMASIRSKIELPTYDDIKGIISFIDQEAKKYNGRNSSISFLKNEIITTMSMDSSGDYKTDSSNMLSLFVVSLSGINPSTKSIIQLIVQNKHVSDFIIEKNDLDDYLNKAISSSDFEKRIKIIDYK